MFHYRVARGDSLWKICDCFAIKIDDVFRLNKHLRRRPHRLKVGEIIVLPVRDAQDCRVPEPVIAEFVPSGAAVIEVTPVRLSGRRVPERVIIFREANTSGVVVIDFTCRRGWREVWRRTGVNLQLRILAVGRLTGDDREQVVIGADTDGRVWFFILGWGDGLPRVLLDWTEQTVRGVVVRIEAGALVVAGPTGGTRYTWDGRGFTGTPVSPSG